MNKNLSHCKTKLTRIHCEIQKIQVDHDLYLEIDPRLTNRKHYLIELVNNEQVVEYAKSADKILDEKLEFIEFIRTSEGICHYNAYFIDPERNSQKEKDRTRPHEFYLFDFEVLLFSFFKKPVHCLNCTHPK